MLISNSNFSIMAVKNIFLKAFKKKARERGGGGRESRRERESEGEKEGRSEKVQRIWFLSCRWLTRDQFLAQPRIPEYAFPQQ